MTGNGTVALPIIGESIDHMGEILVVGLIIFLQRSTLIIRL